MNWCDVDITFDLKVGAFNQPNFEAVVERINIPNFVVPAFEFSPPHILGENTLFSD